VAEEYTLDNLINLGLEKSYEIQKEMVNKQNSNSYFRSSIYDLLPTVYANAQEIKQYENTYSDTSFAVEWKKNGYFEISKIISLNDPALYNIGSSIYNMKSAKKSFEQSEKEIAFNIFS